MKNEGSNQLLRALKELAKGCLASKGMKYFYALSFAILLLYTIFIKSPDFYEGLMWFSIIAVAIFFCFGIFYVMFLFLTFAYSWLIRDFERKEAWGKAFKEASASDQEDVFITLALISSFVIGGFLSTILPYKNDYARVAENGRILPKQPFITVGLFEKVFWIKPFSVNLISETNDGIPVETTISVTCNFPDNIGGDKLFSYASNKDEHEKRIEAHLKKRLKEIAKSHKSDDLPNQLALLKSLQAGSASLELPYSLNLKMSSFEFKPKE